MKFTLIHYTENWETGNTVELSEIPTVGSVIWVSAKHRDEPGNMFYVDNVMYPETGFTTDDAICLFVRPYAGYESFSPKTESDRLAEKLIQTVNLEKKNLEKSTSIESVSAKILEASHLIANNLAENTEIMESVQSLTERIADHAEDSMAAILAKLNDIVMLLEDIKNDLER